MIIRLDNKAEIDTDRDFSAAERHVLQKLFGWKTLVDSLEMFRIKKKSALTMGWNGSGPIRETPNMLLVVQQLERELLVRLKTETKN